MLYPFIIFYLSLFTPVTERPQKVFDVHIHGSPDLQKQVTALKNAGVYRMAVSTSWNLQEQYSNIEALNVLQGLMFPCPLGKVPYSSQNCFTDGKEWPAIEWVEKQIKSKKIDFLGEVLTQYYGISSSDSIMYPYYRLAEKYNLPVGIHTGGAGPNHGSPNFSMAMGDPGLLKKMLSAFPKMKVWIMHAGDMHYRETIRIMNDYPNVYTDISVISFPPIVPTDSFAVIIHEFIKSGLEDRIMFGSDNFDIDVTINNVRSLKFLSDKQKKKIFYKNAERFFRK